MCKEKILLIVSLLIIAAAALFLRINAHLTEKYITYDGAVYSSLAELARHNHFDYDPRKIQEKVKKAMPEQGVPEYLQRPIFKHPPLFVWALSLMPHNFHAVACIPIFFGCAMVLLMIYLGYRLGGRAVALLASLFLSVDPLSWTISGKILMDSMLAFWMSLGVALFLFKRDHRWGWFWIGFVCGLAMLTKYSGFFTLLVILAYSVFFARSWLCSHKCAGMILTAITVFFPWIVWNMRVYGAEFWHQMLGAHVSAVNESFFSGIIPGLLIIAVLISAIIVFRRAGTTATFTFFEGFEKYFAIAAASVIAGILAMAWFQSDFRQAAGNMINFWHLPDRGYSMSFFHGPRPGWTVYIGKLIELSPLYALGFICMPYFAANESWEMRFISFYTALMLVFFTWYGEYESRYVMPASAFILFMAAAGLTRIWNWAKTLKHASASSALKSVVVLWVAWTLLKTLRIGSAFAFGQTLFF